MSRRRLIHGLGVLSAIAAITRGTNLFLFFTRAEASTQNRARVVEIKSFTREDWQMLARTYEEIRRRKACQHSRLVRPYANKSTTNDNSG